MFAGAARRLPGELLAVVSASLTALLSYVNRYHAFVTALHDSLCEGVTPSLLELEGVFHPFFHHMEAVLQLLQGVAPGQGRAPPSAVSAVEPAFLLTALYECYCTQSLLRDDAWTALLLCLFLAALEPYLDHLDTVSPPVTCAHSGFPQPLLTVLSSSYPVTVGDHRRSGRRR